MSQDTLPSPLPIGSLSQYYYTHCTSWYYSKYGSRYGSKYCILQYGFGLNAVKTDKGELKFSTFNFNGDTDGAANGCVVTAWHWQFVGKRGRPNEKKDVCSQSCK